MKSNLFNIGFGGKLLIGDASTCDEISDLELIYVNVDKNLSCKANENQKHHEFKLPSPYTGDYSLGAKTILKSAIDEVVYGLESNRKVVVHSVNPDLSLLVAACSLHKIGSYPTFEDAIYYVTKKKSTGRMHDRLIKAGQELFSDK